VSDELEPGPPKEVMMEHELLEEVEEWLEIVADISPEGDVP
jgi:hypothetical protein